MAHDHPHVHGPDCDHDHAPGADHTHAPTGEYYLEQLLTLFVSGAFGLVAVLLNRRGMLNVILAPEFHRWVLVGGVVLLVFTAIRGVHLWRTAGQPVDCGHDHGPGEDHTHGGMFWRVVVLAFPLLLFALGLPNQGFSQDWVNRRLGVDSSITAGEIASKGGETATFEFHDLNATALDPDKRAYWEGRPVRVKGQLNRIGDREFTLYKLKMNCCAADIVPLKARVLTGFTPTLGNGAWVWADGVLQFVEQPEKKQWIPVIRVAEPKGLADIKNKAEWQ